MTFDPETLYAKPSPGRRIHPAVFVVGGLTAAVVIGGIATMDRWLPGDDQTVAGPPKIRSNDSSNSGAPLAFPERYDPVVYAPPPAPVVAPTPSAVEQELAKPVPTPAPRPAGPPKKPGIPDEARRSMVVLDNPAKGGSGRAVGPSQGEDGGQGYDGPGSDGQGSVQRVAARGDDRTSFYGDAGRSSDAFKPTGIAGKLGRCSLPPGYYIFVDAIGVISTDTPGQVTAKTSRPIFAGIRGECYASPPGATLVGTFNSNTAYGQERIQLAWTTLILPSGSMIPLGGMPGAAGDGGAGLAADVDNHIGALAGAILAGTAVDVIRGLAVGGRGGDGNDVVVTLGNSLSERTASVGERLVDRELNRRPTLTAKPEEIAVQVTRPIDLEPYRD